MTADEFLLTKPCLEEITGFLQGLPDTPTQLTDADRDKLNQRRADLMEGRVIPGFTTLRRAFTYRLGKRPAKLK